LTIPSNTHSRLFGALVVVAALAYLIPFVGRGWVPHDEGMLGQSADRVLHGALPHVDYEEPYTGGLTYLYAALFRVAGVDLIHVRWLLFVAAAGAMCLTYAVTRRQLPPLGAAAATWVAATWSFPNYFAGLPSWWLLLCALLQLWAMVRAVETDRARYVALAAAAAGAALAIKQTGAYLVVSLVLWVLYDGGVIKADSRLWDRVELAARWGAGAAALAFAAVMVGLRLTDADGLYLFAPAAATAAVLFVPRRRCIEPRPGGGAPLRTALAVSFAIVPLVILLMPYAVTQHLADFVNGALILPQKRLAFATMRMPSGWWILAAAPLICGAVLERRRLESWPVWATACLWLAAIALPVAALRNASAYQIIWQSTRAFAAILPIVIVCQIVFGRVRARRANSMLFATAVVLAWTSLNQFPFAAPIYFSYTTPLVVIAGVAAADAAGCLQPRLALPMAALLLTFAILITNRGNIHSLGRFNEPDNSDTQLGLRRAHLRVSSGEAGVYRQLLATIARQYHSGQLIAGPDCPEVYFLAGLQSPSGALFDFFSASSPDDITPWLKGNIVIINHDPSFSTQPSAALVMALRREFVSGEEAGRFEIRWR